MRRKRLTPSVSNMYKTKNIQYKHRWHVQIYWYNVIGLGCIGINVYTNTDAPDVQIYPFTTSIEDGEHETDIVLCLSLTLLSFSPIDCHDVISYSISSFYACVYYFVLYFLKLHNLSLYTTYHFYSQTFTQIQPIYQLLGTNKKIGEETKHSKTYFFPTRLVWINFFRGKSIFVSKPTLRHGIPYVQTQICTIYESGRFLNFWKLLFRLILHSNITGKMEFECGGLISGKDDVFIFCSLYVF